MRGRVFLFLALVASARAANAVFTVTFEHTNGTDPSLEYVVELKRPDGSFVEVVKGPSSPLVFAINSSWGLYVVRVYVRRIPMGRRIATSPEASTTLAPGNK